MGTNKLRVVTAVVFLLLLAVGMLWIRAGNEGLRELQSSPLKVRTKIGYLPITDHLILGISKERDGLHFRHVALTPVKYSGWKIIASNLRSGHLDGAFLLAPLAMKMRHEGIPIKIVLLAHRDGSAITVSVGKGIDTPQDIKGKTLAIPEVYSTHNYLLHSYLSKYGLSYGKDFTTIELSPSDMPLALSRGEIDGYIVAEPFGAKAELLGIGKVLVLSSEIWKNHPDCVLVMREEYLSANPGAAGELMESLIEAGRFAEQNRDEASRIGIRFLGHTREVLDHALKEPADRVTFLDLVPRTEELDSISRYMHKQMGLPQVQVNVQELVDESFANAAYKKEIRKRDGER